MSCTYLRSPFRERRVNLVQMVKMELLEHLESLEMMEHQETLETKEKLETRVVMLQSKIVPHAHHLVPLKDSKAALVCQEIPADQVDPAPVDHPVNLADASLEVLENLVNLVNPVNLDSLENPVNQVNQADLEKMLASEKLSVPVLFSN